MDRQNRKRFIGSSRIDRLAFLLCERGEVRRDQWVVTGTVDGMALSSVCLGLRSSNRDRQRYKIRFI